MAEVQLSDVIVPEIFTPYQQQLTQVKSRLIHSGAVVRDPLIDGLLAGPGLTFHIPSFTDLANDSDNVSSDNAGDSAPKKNGTGNEIAVRLSRNQSWRAADLVRDLIGPDPLTAIAGRVAAYWTRRLQVIMVNSVQGVYANNDANQMDMTNDVSGVSFVQGVTNFTGEAYIDAAATIGDSADQLTMLMVHSIVFARMKKNNLIDFIPDAEGHVQIPTYQGAIVIVDDGMPNPAGVSGVNQTSSGIFHSWLFGPGALRFGMGQAKVPTEVFRYPNADNGAGSESLHSRQIYAMHPAGYAWVGDLSAAPGGPANGNGSTQLGAATSWTRAVAERKMIKMARLITRES